MSRTLVCRSLLIVFPLTFLLLLAWPGWAAEPTSWRYMTCPSDPLRQCRVIANVIEDPPKDVVCLAQLEAAMRAMDAFGPSVLMKVFMSGAAYGKGMLKDKDVGDWMGEAVKTQKQWEAAKTACWREKP